MTEEGSANGRGLLSFSDLLTEQEIDATTEIAGLAGPLLTPDPG